jgi:molybdopterin molybdotransferase
MLDFDQAQTLLANAAGPLQRSEEVSLADAAGRVLAADLTATVDIPPADNSAMDGYALRVADWGAGVRLPIQQRCYAGEMPEPLKPGHAIRLFTGSLIPEGADTVSCRKTPPKPTARWKSRVRPRPASTSAAAAKTPWPARRCWPRAPYLKPPTWR